MPKFIRPKFLDDYPNQTLLYQNISPRGQLHIDCPRCRGPVLLFESLSDEVKREISELRSDTMVRAMDQLRHASACSIAHAKAGVFHICKEINLCHNCQSPLQPGALLCPQCMAVNLNW